MSEAHPPHEGDADGCVRLAFNFAPADQRERLEAAMALRDAVLASTTTSSERQVCQTQLAWWRDELARTAAGQPRHPLARRLADGARLDDNASALMMEWPVLAARTLDGAGPDSSNQWRIRAFRLHGTALLLSVTDPTLRETLVRGFRDCAVGISLLDAAFADTSELAIVTAGLATHAAASDHVALAVLARLLDNALRRQRDGSEAPGALRQLFLAWRCARASRRRQLRSNEQP